MSMLKASNNESLIDRLENELPKSTVYWMLIAIVTAQAWTIYLTYYNSRVLGLIITAILNKFVKYGHIRMGSFSFSVLSGKVMFRDVHLITEDFSVRAEYGWLIFRWWRPYVYKELTEDMSHMETRMSVFLDGFEFHVYNKSTVYKKLVKLFRDNGEEESDEVLSETTTSKQTSRFQGLHWRDLIPVIKIEIASGRWIFGNYLLPYSALFKFDKANAVYTTKPASTVFDKFMHVLKCDMENARLMLVPSPKYNGPVQDEPPRFMGEGFVVLLSNDLEFYYYQDEPGIVQLEPEQIQMADGEVLVKRTYPCVGVDIKCGKNTDFNYGPWVERQREVIWKFFYPVDYQPIVPTKEAEPGELRQFKTMEVKLTINAISTFDILFTKNSVTQALHMNAGKGSYVEVTVPYIVEDAGYVTKVKGQLMLVDATTSMPFRSLVECETFEFDVTAFYPRDWNACQEWRCDLTACKAVVYLIYDLKTFFSDLVDDWSSKSAPDIYSFVPYNFTLSLVIKQFELLTLANENNWVDTSSQHQENAHIAFCGELFELCVTFPFNDFLPKSVPVNLVIKGETVFCRLHLPESNNMKHALIAISENMKIVDREGNEIHTPIGGDGSKQWRNVTLKSNGWVDCWTTPYVFLTVVYTYYPMPVLLSQSPTERVAHLSLSSPILEEEVGDELSYLDIPPHMLPGCSTSRHGSASSSGDRCRSGGSGGAATSASVDKFDPGVMEPDVIQVELEVAPSVLILYGSLLRNLIHLKENYLGEYQKATDFDENPGQTKDMEASYVHVDNPDCDEKPFDPRTYRPFSVTVSVTLHDIQAHLAKNCAKDGLPCPSAHVERLCFEMDKTFKETKLQVLLSPCVLLAKDCLVREGQQDHLRDGHLALSGLQVRGHAMFSLEGLPLDSETLEYGWLIEVIVGEVTGKLTTPQLQNIAEFLQTFIMMIENAENKLQTSLPFKQCQHMLAQDDCPHQAQENLPFPCPTSEEVKYEMTRVSVDFVSIFLVESGSALNVQVHPIRIANCNLHGPSTRAGITGLVDKLELKQYVSTASRSRTSSVCAGVSTTGSQAGKLSLDKWLEAGGFALGPIMLEAAMALPHPLLYQNQDKFLRLHDAKTKRLWFLWKDRDLSTPTLPAVAGKCGCLGGCVFFGMNKNGLTFFKVKRHKEGAHGVAVPQVSKDGADPGFGQSLLHAGKLVFETSQLALRIASSPTKGTTDGHFDVIDGFAFTRGYMSELASPDTDGAGEEGHQTAACSPLEDGRPKSTFSDTQMLLASSGTRQVEIRHHSSRDVFLMRQGSLPTTDRVVSQMGVVLRPGSKKRKRSAPVPAMSPTGISGADSISIGVVSHSLGSGSQHTSQADSDKLDTISSISQYYSSRHCGGGSSPQSPILPASQSHLYSSASAVTNGCSSIAPGSDLSRPVSNISIDSEAYVTANEDTDTESGHATLTRDSTLVSSFSVGSEDESYPSTIKRAPIPTTTSTTNVTTTPTTLTRENSSSIKRRTRSRSHHRKGSTRRLRQQMQQHLHHQTPRANKTAGGDSVSSSEDEEGESTLSFCSAPSENEFDLSGSDVDPEDLIDMINLHSHMNLPITESPLLLSCYSQHLSHYYCQDWCSTAPQLAVYASRFQGLNSVQSEYSLSSAGHSVYSAGAAWMPHFLKVKEGFSVNVMKPRADVKKGSPTNVASDLFTVKATLDREHMKQQQQNDDGASQESLTDNTSKTTAIVQLSGSVDVLVTPLLLEALQRYVEAVTPTLSKLHPSALIDGQHSQCLDRLKQQNKLKKGKEWEGSKEEGSYDNLSSYKEVTPVKTSSLQALFTLPKINICVLQASIVEQVIAFSNLGSASDLTAVSLLAVCIDGVKCQLLSNKHSCKVAVESSKEPLTRKTSATPTMVKFSSSSQNRGKTEITSQEPDIENPQEVTREENVGTLHISHIHVQLRRLLKFSNFSEHVLLTAIPEHSSRVLFTLEQDTSTPLSTLPLGVNPAATTSSFANTATSTAEGNIGINVGVTPSPKRRLSRTSSRDREREREREAGDGGSLSGTLGRGASDTPSSISSPYPIMSHAAASLPTLSAPSIGFIMCECGLEDVSVTAVRRLGYQDTTQEAQEVEDKLVGMDRTISQMEESARVKVEGHSDDQKDGGQDNTTKGKTSAMKSDGKESKTGEKVKHEREEEDSNTDDPTVLSSPSGNVHSQSLSSESGSDQSSKDSSWASDRSAASSETPVASAATPAALPEPLEGDASNGRLELKTIWFYFASPPPISIHKKVDYTRLDWNLLSTATPAIDAWLNPSDRLMTSVRCLVREYSRRLCCVIACMMIEGLESQGIHVAYKSKFNKLTPLSKTLQEDPSNQLLTVLRKYLHKHGTSQVERAVSVETVPQLITVQKGILALMRQWKNVLYMPNLSQVNFKSRRSIRPYNVKFALPKEENADELGVGEEQEEVIVDQFDVVDERMSLLQAEGGITQRSGSVPSIGSKRLSVSTQGKTDGDFVSAESYSASAKPRKLSSIFRSKTRAPGAISDSHLDHSSSNLAPPPPPTSGLLLSRNDSNISFTSMSSSSNDQEMLVVATPPHTPLRHPGPKQSILKNKYHQNEDLYQWMAKQQTEKDHFRMDLHDEDEASRYLRQNTSESCAAATGHLGSAWSQDDSRLDVNDGGDYTMATSIMQLADAQILFKPVLQSLGLHVESVRPSAMMKKFGGHLLLQGHFTTFKILIAESEARPGEGGHPPSQHPSKGKGRDKRTLNNRILADSAAFQCENFDVNVSLEDVVDFGEDGQASKFPYKFAMHKLEAKPTTLQINFLVNCQAIRQNVDMALLRLAHQVLTMVGNVKETRVELKQKRMEPGATWVQTHRKQDSKDSTSSVETNHSDTSHTERLMGSFTNILALEKDRELMLAKTKSGSMTPVASRAGQDPEQPMSSSLLFQKSLGQALESRLNSSGALKLQSPGVSMDPSQPQSHLYQHQYQSSPAAMKMDLSPGVHPVSPSVAARRVIAPSPLSQLHNGTPASTSGVVGSGKYEAAAAERKADVPKSWQGGMKASSPAFPAATGVATASSPVNAGALTMSKPGVRPEVLPIGDAVQAKKPSQLRFAKGSKEDHPQTSTKKVSTPHPNAASIMEGAAMSSSDVLTPPHSLNLSDCTVVLDMADTSSPALNQKTIIDEIKESTPQCWRHLYQLLELYATMPEPKTVSVPVTQAVSKLPVIEEEDPDQEGSVKRESRVSDYGSKLSTLIQNRKSSMLHSLRRDSSSDGHELAAVGGKLDGTVGHQDKNGQPMTKVDVSAKEEETLGNNSLAHQSFIRTRFKQSIYVGESIPLIVYGILKVEKVLISAELSGLKLEANTTKVHASGTYKKKVKGFLHRVSSDSSYTAHVGHSMINLREGEPPDWQTVVTININKSQGLLTSVMRRGKEHNSTLVTVGVIDIDIPQHPVILHDMMSRSSKRITATLQELRWPAQSNKMHFSSEDNSNQSASNIAAAAAAAADTSGVSNTSMSGAPFHVKRHHTTGTSTSAANNSNVAGTGVWRPATEADKVIRKHLHIKAVLQGIKVGASILPSLKAQYKTDAIKLTGVLGKRAHFTVTLPTHMLSFKSRITAAAALAETPIPSGASIDLPPIQVIADYRVQKPGGIAGATFSPRDDHNEVDLGEELELLQGNYLYAVAEVGMLEHSLTTDLLNHLVFVQKVFMKEINEIVQKVSGTGPVDEVKSGKDDLAGPASKPLLYSVSVRFKGIQVTATTPTSNAVRFETGAITLDLSNRFHLPKKDAQAKESSTEEEDKYSSSQKMFIQAVVDLNLALGQLLKNPVFEEAEPEFHTMAFFKTTIKVRNALQHEMIPTLSHDQEALLINLSRPIILAQPLAFDKAVLVWLNYKNAYEYWTEQRMALNKEVLHATRQVIDKLPHMAPATSPSISTLFLQLTVDDMGICVPLLSSPYQPIPAPAPGFQSPRVAEAEQGSALVLTVESTQISACSSGSLVSKGKFKNFCLRFADDFGSSWDDWKPWPSDSGAVMNQCNVPSGTYEVCSRTINKQDAGSRNAKWIVNVQWEMKGIDVHLDTDIGKRFTLLGHTLTLLAGEGEEELLMGGESNTTGLLGSLCRDIKDGVDGKDEEDEDDALSSPDTQDNSLEDLQLLKRRTSLASDILPEEIFLDTFDPKERARKIEREMNEQAKIVQELKECGATEGTIEIERKKLEDLQALLFQDFRRDFMEKLKRQGDRASIIKDKLGLGTRPATHMRSKSTGTHRMTGAYMNRHRSVDISAGDRRQSEDLTRMPKVSFSGHQLSTYTPPGSPDLHTYAESESEHDEEETFTYSRQRSRSLEAIPSSGSDSQLDESLPYRRKKTASEDSGSVTSRDQAIKLAEQNVDFELDVKVFIDSGKCVLYPKEAKEEEVRKYAKKEKLVPGDAGSSNGAQGSSSPPSKRKLKKEVSGGSISSRRKLSANPDTTIFFVPSLAVKIHYNSKTDHMAYMASPGSTIIEEPEVSPGYHTSSVFATPPYQQYMNSSETPVGTHFSGGPRGVDADSSGGSGGGGPLWADYYGSPRRSSQQKKASLYAWFTLQTLPEEMIISPTLLDFLEQALEPLPVNPNSSSILKKDMMLMDSLVNNMDLDASQASLGQQSMAFFPVDVVVHIKVDPSFIRFNCHPVSRVECLLQVPSLDLFFSTKKSDINESMLADIAQTPRASESHGSRASRPASSSISSTPQGPNSSSTTTGGSGYHRTRHTSGVSDTSASTLAGPHPGPSSSSGGLSVTGCMSDFSLYIFHPYGTGVQRRLAGHGDPAYKAQPGLERIAENATNAIHDLGRRDSLSLNVEYIRVNISRTRKLETYSELGGDNGTGGGIKAEQQVRSNAVRFSAICDIGTASFKYDMRRLSEILSLPKAWYRRTLARRLFLGDDSMNVNPGEECEPCTPENSGRPVSMGHNSVSHPTLNEIAPPTTPLRKHHRRGSSGDKIRIQLSPEFKTEIATRRGHNLPSSSYTQATNATTSDGTGGHFSRDPVSSSSAAAHRKRSRTLASPDMPRHRHSVSGASGNTGTAPPVTATLSSSWETLVLFAVNLSQLNLEVNMANVMGNTEWHLNAIKTQGRLSINSSGHKNLNIDAGFGKTSLESKGGIVGGTIDINNLQGFFSVCEDPLLGQDPDHQAGLSTSALEMKLDYMGSSIIMTRLSHLQLLLKDEWHVDTDSQSDAPLATNRSAFLFVNGKLSWSHLHLMISRSTTPDLIKIISKLDEFFSQQVMSSRRVFQASGYPPPASASKVPRKTSESTMLNELRHHRHWQAALGHLLGHQFSMLPSGLLPQQGMVLGGTMALQGQGLMLASFHGVNFRAKCWALFNIKDPYIHFSTEAQKIPSGGTHIVEDLQFIVGQQQGSSREPTGVTSPQALHNHQATICKITRTQHMPPNFTSVDEWFTYAMTSSVTDAKVVTEFPGARTEEDSGRKFSKVKAAYYSHETEVIFAFPSLYMDLKTSHLQGETMPEENDERPIVECSFVAEFYDHIYVAMNAEVILFLHDLVSSYIREKDRSSGPRMSTSKASKTDSSKLSDPTSALKADFRSFQCKTWQLEPTIRLIHWASTQIDPVGADYVLQKLGFSHARVTIPKWVQRGFMDPLDKVLSVLVDKLITTLRDQGGGAVLDDSPDQEAGTG